ARRRGADGLRRDALLRALQRRGDELRARLRDRVLAGALAGERRNRGAQRQGDDETGKGGRPHDRSLHRPAHRKAPNGDPAEHEQSHVSPVEHPVLLVFGFKAGNSTASIAPAPFTWLSPRHLPSVPTSTVAAPAAHPHPTT